MLLFTVLEAKKSKTKMVGELALCSKHGAFALLPAMMEERQVNRVSAHGKNSQGAPMDLFFKALILTFLKTPLLKKRSY